jgi:hypothetical protein
MLPESARTSSLDQTWPFLRLALPGPALDNRIAYFSSFAFNVSKNPANTSNTNLHPIDNLFKKRDDVRKDIN